MNKISTHTCNGNDKRPPATHWPENFSALFKSVVPHVTRQCTGFAKRLLAEHQELMKLVQLAATCDGVTKMPPKHRLAKRVRIGEFPVASRVAKVTGT
jgi:hypothetical protein